MKPLRVSAAAAADVDAIMAWYQEETGATVRDAFISAVEYALRFLTDMPGAGSPRLRAITQSPCVRVWPLRGFPHLVIYDDLPDRTDILRILHTARDIPASLRE